MIPEVKVAVRLEPEREVRLPQAAQQELFSRPRNVWAAEIRSRALAIQNDQNHDELILFFTKVVPSEQMMLYKSVIMGQGDTDFVDDFDQKVRKLQAEASKLVDLAKQYKAKDKAQAKEFVKTSAVHDLILLRKYFEHLQESANAASLDGLMAELNQDQKAIQAEAEKAKRQTQVDQDVASLPRRTETVEKFVPPRTFSPEVVKNLERITAELFTAKTNDEVTKILGQFHGIQRALINYAIYLRQSAPQQTEQRLRDERLRFAEVVERKAKVMGKQRSVANMPVVPQRRVQGN